MFLFQSPSIFPLNQKYGCPLNFDNCTGGGWWFVGENKKKGIKIDSLDFCDSYRIQTCNLLIRSQMLYSVELTSQRLIAIATAKLSLFSELTITFCKYFFQKIFLLLHFSQVLMV